MDLRQLLLEAQSALLFHKLAILLLLIVVCYLWWWTSQCRCEKCAFHVNEQRMARLREAEAQHDNEHKGWDFATGEWKDKLPCRDPSCPRNPKR